jgi:asparagine synthase (glutamine-hydrolysing)
MIFGEFVRQVNAQRFSDKLIDLSTQGVLTQIIPADTCGHWSNETTTLVQHTQHNTLESKAENGPIHDSEAQLTITAWARIDNREELAHLLGMNSSELGQPDAWFILKSYQKWGEDCVEHLFGDFVFAIVDCRKQKIFCARDHMGVRPFYYHLSDDRFIFGTHLAFFHHLGCCELEPSSRWMSDYLTDLSMSFDETPYAAISKLAPAHCLTITRSQALLRRYFQFSADDRLVLKDSNEYVDAYREQLETAIKCRVRSEYMIGAELSGGMDSSTITAYAAKFLTNPQQQLHAFAFVHCELEPEYVHAITQSTLLAATHVFTSRVNQPEQYQQRIARALSIFGYPEEHGNGSGHESFYQMAEQLNIRTLLSGHGGDEFVTASAGLVLTELYNEGRYKDLYNAMKGNTFTRLLRVLKTIVNKHRNTNTTYNSRFYEAYSQRWEHQLVKQQWAKQYDLHARYIQTAMFDAPYQSLNEFTLQNRWAPFVSTRMENCTLMAAARNIEYRWPLLDVRLIKLFLSIPSIEKYNHGTSRLLHRRAINDVVHHKVVWKPSKDMGQSAGRHDMLTNWQSLLKVEELHPKLTDLIDQQKLSQQLIEVGSLRHDLLSNLWLQVNININKLLWLNQWLHRYH